MKPGENCKIGSAWHVWQSAGSAWRGENPVATRTDAKHAAESFAAVPGWPEAGRNARRRAFLECAA